MQECFEHSGHQGPSARTRKRRNDLGTRKIQDSQLNGRITPPVIGRRREQAQVKKEARRHKEAMETFLAKAPTQPGWPIEAQQGIARRLLGKVICFTACLEEPQKTHWSEVEMRET